jgi:hypothetical protein
MRQVDVKKSPTASSANCLLFHFVYSGFILILFLPDAAIGATAG